MNVLTEEQKKYFEKRNQMLIKGLKEGEVFPYSDDLFDHLRPYCVAGFPASIMLFITEMCNGHCYDRSLLMTLAFEECKLVHADIESLELVYGKSMAGHSYVETNEFGGGTWVVDTSAGLVYKKEIYDMFEKPKVIKVNSKKACMKSHMLQEILAADFEKEKYSLTLTMPFIEAALENSNDSITSVYKSKLQEELRLFKEAIGYDELVAEEKTNMELMRKDPKALDRKLGIVRDEYGNEVSRNGVPNKYYVERGSLDTEEGLESFRKKNLLNRGDEELEVKKRAALYIKKVKLNPKANFYDIMKKDSGK